LEIELIEFSDWQIKRLRTRLFALYQWEKLCFKSDRERSKSFDLKKSKQKEHDPLDLPIINNPPSWMSLAHDICGDEDCLEILEYNEDAEEINRKLGKPPSDDGIWGDVKVKGHNDGGWPVKDGQLTNFAKGYKEKATNTRPAYWKYTTPELDVLNAIYIYLKKQAFISNGDIIDPFSDVMSDRAKVYLSALGIRPEPIHYKNAFNGDYVSLYKSENGEHTEFFTIHLSPDKQAYRMRLIEVIFDRQRLETPQMFAQRKDRGNPNSLNKFAAWSYFNQECPFIYVMWSEANHKKKQTENCIPYAFTKKNENIVCDFIRCEYVDGISQLKPISILNDEDVLKTKASELRLTLKSHIFSVSYEKILAKFIENDNMTASGNNKEGGPERPLKGKFLLKKSSDTVEQETSPSSEMGEMSQKSITEMSQDQLGQELLECCFTGNGDRASDLIEVGVDVNYESPNSKSRAIHLASGNSAIFVLDVLLSSKNIDLLVKDFQGRLPSALASEVACNSELTEKIMKAEMQQAIDRGIDYPSLLVRNNPKPADPSV